MMRAAEENTFGRRYSSIQVGFTSRQTLLRFAEFMSQPMLVVADSHIEQRQLSLTERIVEQAAGYEQRLTGLGKQATTEQNLEIRRLSQQYHILRITLVSGRSH